MNKKGTPTQQSEPQLKRPELSLEKLIIDETDQDIESVHPEIAADNPFQVATPLARKSMSGKKPPSVLQMQRSLKKPPKSRASVGIASK